MNLRSSEPRGRNATMRREIWTFLKLVSAKWASLVTGAFSALLVLLGLGISIVGAFGLKVPSDSIIQFATWVLAAVCGGYATFSVWYREHVEKEKLQEKLIVKLKNRQKLLNEIGELRIRIGAIRIEMENDFRQRKFSEAEWQPKFDSLQDEIAAKIEHFASPAEAHIYRHRGNIQRPISPMGGFLNPLLVDICIHDLNHLDQFIRDYSRQKERGT